MVTVTAEDGATTETYTVTVTRAAVNNAAPTASDSSVTINEDTAHTFAAVEFNFADTDPGAALASVTVVTLSAAGALTFDGGTAVATGEAVSAAAIGTLVFTPAANANGSGYASFTFRVSDGTHESSAYTMTVHVTALDDPATGAPTIGGTARVGAMRTAATTDIADVDGLAVATYGHQWVRVDADGTSNATDIAVATLGTYTPVEADVGKNVRVKVSFTDDGGGEEELTSDAYPASGTIEVAAAGICGRTPAVRDALVARISVISNCADVTDVHLAAITGFLNLGNQNITALAAGDFAGLTALTDLWLLNNELTTLPGDVFDGLTSLQILYLSGNGLATLPGDVFDELTLLTDLRLTDNALDRLPAGVFDNLTALEVLRLDDNALDMLPDDVFEPLTSLTDVILSGNLGVPFAPEAVALPDDETVSSGGTVTLDGSGSDGGAWGTNVFYAWALTTPASGVTVSFDDNTSVTPQVTIPALAADTDLTFTLTVTGRGGTSGIASATDTATVATEAPRPATPSLTAELTSDVREHDGRETFRVDLQFSEEVELERDDVRSGRILRITNGHVVEAVTLDGGTTDGWWRTFHARVAPGFVVWSRLIVALARLPRAP